MIQTAIILAGGFGTRLREVVQNIPKPMAPVNNKPFLSYQLDFLSRSGIKNVIISTGHLAQAIHDYFGEEYKGMLITYSHEETPLGTGGAIRLAAQKVEEDFFFVLNGDSFFQIDLQKLEIFHLKVDAHFSMALRRVENANRYGIVEIDPQGKIVSFHEKSSESGPGLINSGIYVFSKKRWLDTAPEKKRFSIENDFFACVAGKEMIFGLVMEGYFIDIGIPEDYLKAQNEFRRFES